MTGPKQKQCSVVYVSGGESKVQCCKEHYCTGTWNIRSMNQGKLEVVKQEIARLNINILGISELKWTRMGEFNLDDSYIYYCGQGSLRRNEVSLIINKRVWNAIFGCSVKNDRMMFVCLQGKPFDFIVQQFLVFWGTPILFSPVAAPAYIPTNSVGEFFFLHTRTL